jgi:hypothetical protein
MLTYLRPTRLGSSRRVARLAGAWLLALTRGLRATLLVTAVFSLAMVAGGLAAEVTADLLAVNPDPLRLAADQTPPTPAAAGGTSNSHRVFALSLIYSGSVALLVSITGMIIVARRRRLW